MHGGDARGRIRRAISLAFVLLFAPVLGHDATAAELAPSGPAGEAPPPLETTAPDGSVAPPPPTARKRAAQWWYGYFDPGPTQNCVFQYPEPLGSTWAGWYGDLGVTPTTDD